MCVIFEQQNFFVFVLVYSKFYTIFVGELVKGTNHLFTYLFKLTYYESIN